MMPVWRERHRCKHGPILLLLLASCGEAGARPDLSSVRDSAGVTIIDNVFPDSADVRWWAIETVPLLDIGGAEAEEAQSLFQVGDARRLADGRIVVTNGGAGDVRYYAAGGAHIRTTGRRGDGPGEFQRPGSILLLPGDSILVVERFGGRASVLDPDGSFARDFRMGADGPGVGVVGRLGDGSFVATRVSFAPGDVSDGLQRQRVTLVTLGADGTVIDSVVTLPGAERVIHLSGSAGALTSVEIRTPPFARSTVFAARGDEIFAGTQDSPQIDVYDTDGSLRRIVRTGAPMETVTPEHIGAWIERVYANAPPEIREQHRGRRDDPNAGEAVPPYSALEIDDAGNLWVADYDDRIDPAGGWSIHDAEGRLVARIRLPARFRPFHIGNDFILGVLPDDLDVEHIRLHRLLKHDER
jgi:hypothetical protein